MKKAMIFAVTLALASASAFAGTAVFNGAAMNPAFGSGAAPVFHPAQVAAAGAANFIVEPSAAGGIDITRWGGRSSFFLSATGAATNDALFVWNSTADYTVTYKFTVAEFVRTDPPAGRFRFNPSITVAANGSWGAQNNIDLAGALHEGSKLGLEFNADSPANLVQLRVWDEGARPFYTVPATLEWPSGNPGHNLASGNPNRVPAADLVGKEITIRISRNGTTGDLTWAMKIDGYGYWSVMRTVVTIPNTVIAVYQDSRDTANFRFQGAIQNFSAVIEGAGVLNLNSELLGAEGVPSMATPFFTE